MSFTPFMNQSDAIRFAALMESFNAFAKNDPQENWARLYDQRCEQLGNKKAIRLVNLASFYITCISTELDIIRREYRQGKITEEQFQLISKFAARRFQGNFSVDQVEEMEWRFHCLKERAIPTTKPFEDVIAHRCILRNLQELNRKIQQSKGKGE